MRRFVTSLFSLLLLAVIALALPSLASAHDVLQKTTPADGTTLAGMPSTVSLQFSEPPLAIGTQVIVKGPTGDVATGKPTIEGSTLVQAVSPTAPAGSYTVTYRVTSDDGHPVTGTFSFEASAGADGSPAAPTPATSTPPTTLPATAATSTVAGASASTSNPVANEGSSLVPVLLSVIGVLVVIAVGAFLVLRGRRQQ
ncbi:copper resistance protein CopC [Humibacillus sp. DSM 29435]|uniref:copper resistance CopC family protein n=1 Tax=Humibacillus sp. DSM 29435 TaxID=1869167 RepID=UPI0008727356|nr:copper resistance CopC family protein [Humibacillus sp. DSM 29435]OFE18878.1 copper resistance protein CopC [Humibacillus sp. DSM 29435]